MIQFGIFSQDFRVLFGGRLASTVAGAVVDRPLPQFVSRASYFLMVCGMFNNNV